MLFSSFKEEREREREKEKEREKKRSFSLSRSRSLSLSRSLDFHVPIAALQANRQAFVCVCPEKGNPTL